MRRFFQSMLTMVLVTMAAAPLASGQSVVVSVPTDQTALTGSYSVAVSEDGDVYVSQRGVDQVVKMDPAGEVRWRIGSFGSDPGQFSIPSGIAVDAAGFVYVADSNNHRIQKFNLDGQFVSSFGTPGFGPDELNVPVGLAVDGLGNIYVAELGNHRIQKFNAGGISVLTFGSHGTGDGQFDLPTGVAVDGSGNIFVADQGNNRVQRFTSTGEFALKFGAPDSSLCVSGEIDRPEGLAVDDAGNVYVVMNFDFCVQKFDADGNFLRRFGGAFGFAEGKFAFATGVAVDGTGNVYIADGHDSVQEFSATGAFGRSFGTTGAAESRFRYPQGGVVADNDGNIYVADTLNDRIQKFDRSGTFLLEFGKLTTWPPPPGQVSLPRDVAIDSAGNILTQGFGRIQKFDPAGTFLSGFDGSGSFQFALDAADNIYTISDSVVKFDSTGNVLLEFGSPGSGDGQFHNAIGIAVDVSGNIYVADTDNHRIQKFDPAGTWLMKFGSFGTGAGEFSKPASIAVDAAGNMYVSELENNHRVQVFDPGGTPLLMFGSFGSGDGELIGPFGIALEDPLHLALGIGQNLYVTDTGNHRIQVFRLPDTTPPPAPAQISPANGGLSNDATPSFEWTDVTDKTGVTYKLQVATSSLFTTLLLDESDLTTSAFIPSTDLPDGQKYWRVFAVDGAGNSTPSTIVFTFLLDSTPPPSPILVTPADGALTNDNTPLFDWGNVIDSTPLTYDLIVDEDPGFASPEINFGLASSTFTPTLPLPDGTYFWHTRARDLAGNVGAFGGASMFRIDTVPPDATVSSAVDGDGAPISNSGSTSSTSIAFAFTGTDNLSVARLECSLDAGTFVVCVSPANYTALAVGNHTFQARAIDTAGNPDPTPATFAWTVLTPAQAIQNLVAVISGLNLPTDVTRSLTAPLTRAEAILTDDNLRQDRAVCELLTAFLHQVDVKERNADLTADQAAQLRQAGERIKSTLGCS